ncbi:hypothetical protein AKH21_02560, partial [Pelagibacteraceae bacterium GOM-A5]
MCAMGSILFLGGWLSPIDLFPFNEGQRLQTAIDEAYKDGLLGKNSAGTDWELDIYIHYGAGAY